MPDKNYHSDCGFKGEMISYLYDEIGKREKAIFETHLTNCATCADELAEFSFARFAVEDWRDAEFKNLATPVFAIPPAEKSSSEAVMIKSDSKLTEWFRALTTAPVWATSAAALVVVASLMIAANNIYQPYSIAENKQSIKVSPSAPQTVETPVIASNEAATDRIFAQTETAPINKNNKFAGKESVRRNGSTENGKNSFGKVAVYSPTIKNGRPNNENLTAASVNSNKRARRSSPAASRQIPTLSSFEDDEDNTLRLAELFEQVDSGK